MASFDGLGTTATQSSSSAQLYRSNDPNDIQAALSRLQFEDYKARFRPLEDQLFAMADTPITPAVTNRDLISGIGARDRSRYGVSLDSGETANLDRGLDLSATLADVGAQNTARTATRDQRLNLLTDITGLGRDLVNQSGQSVGQAAQLATQRKNQNDAVKAQQAGSTLSSIGTGAGIGFAVGGPMGAAIGAGAGLILDSIF
jgi:hypothetical protein